MQITGYGRQFDFDTFMDSLAEAFKTYENVPVITLMALQGAVDHHALDAIERGGNAPGGIAEVAARAGAARPKAAHHPGQTLGPVTGAEGFSAERDALDEDFFAGRGDHRVEGRVRDGWAGSLLVASQHGILTLI